MGDRRFRTGSLGSQFGVEDEEPTSAATPSEQAAAGGGGTPQNVDPYGGQSTGGGSTQTPPTVVQQQEGYDVQGIQSLAPAQQPVTYNVQGVQSLATQTQSSVTPAEQSGAQGGDPTNIQPYEDLQAWFNPAEAGGFGTPTELRFSGTNLDGEYANYGPSSIQWSEDANNLALMQQGISPAQMADNSINAVYAFFYDFGVKPYFITPYVAARLGLTSGDLIALNYAQDPYGRWILLDEGPAEDTTAYSYSYDDSGGGYGGRGSRGGSSFRSGYTSGLINWRIGL